MYQLIPYTRCLICLLLFCGCKSQSGSKHPDYDLDHPKVLELPASLDEISGLVFDSTDSGLFAIADEHGIVYKLYPDQPERIDSWNIAADGDYEELALLRDQLWLLQSDGRLTAFRLPLSSGIPVGDEIQVSGKKGEFEALLANPEINSLTLICKSCASDQKRRIGSISYLPDRRTSEVSEFLSLDKNDLKNARGAKVKIHPTAAVRDPIRNRILLLATNPSLLLELTENRDLLQIYPLNASVYNQPEGIALSADGTLYIATERGGSNRSARLLILPRIKASRP